MSRKTHAAASAPAVADEQLAIAIPTGARSPKVQTIARSQIHPDPDQPRQDADDELRASIASQGLLEPITVRPHPDILTEWMIVDGERRWRGSEGILTDLRCIVRTDLHEEVPRLAVQLVANSGKATPPLHEAQAFRRMIEKGGMSIAELAQLLGRAPSTVSERVALTELGAWLPLIESGDVVLSHAVKVLLPLRTVPETHHEHAIALLKKDYRYSKKGAGQGISLGDFENLIRQFYTHVMYPLTKTKSTWHKQPEFNTSKHDAECECGGIKFDLGGGPRLCCGNPGWWKPLHRKAVAAKKAKEPAKQVDSGPKLYLPEGTPTIKTDYGRPPKGVITLTDSSGAWAQPHYGEAFDPADLVIDDAKLVQWKEYGTYVCIGTRDTKAIAAARRVWAERYAAQAAVLDEQLGAAIEAGANRYFVNGAGVPHLMPLLRFIPVIALDVARAIGIAVSEQLYAAEDWKRGDATAAWAATLAPHDAQGVLTGIAVVLATELKTPSSEIDVLQRKAIDRIRRSAIPWKSKPKPAKPAKSAKSAKSAKAGKRAPHPAVALAVAGKTLSAETAEIPLDDPRKPVACIHCGCTEDTPCEAEDGSPCAWASAKPRVCTNPDCLMNEGINADGTPVFTADDDEDDADLWDAATDPLEEANV